MKTIRKILYKILGLKQYLRIVSKLYLKYIDNGFGKDKYHEIHYLKTIIKQGFVCVDIGANLGYYSYFLAKYSGNEGKVYAVEPVPIFAQIWRKNLKKYISKRLVLYPYALGESEKIVEMGMPRVNGVVHHGMTKIIDNQETEFEKTFSVEMKNPDLLFEQIEKIDFIKIDVEGYENLVLDNMQKTIKKHKPLIQSELSGTENRNKCISILQNLGYNAFVLQNGELIPADQNLIENHNNDFYFKFDN